MRAIVSRNRDNAAKRREQSEKNEPYMRKQRGAFDMSDLLGDSSMVACYLELRPLNKKLLDGEMSQVDYDIAKAEACERHGLNRTKRTTV